MSRTHHNYTIIRKADRGSAWLVVHEWTDEGQPQVQCSAWTNLDYARRKIAQDRGSTRIRFQKLSDSHYTYSYTSR